MRTASGWSSRSLLAALAALQAALAALQAAALKAAHAC
jgi:hypothetical protein